MTRAERWHYWTGMALAALMGFMVGMVLALGLISPVQ